jgi:chaperone modulatory protein CbpM
MATEHEEALWLHSGTRISIAELAQFSGFAESMLRELVEYGVLTPADPHEWVFSAECVARLRTAARLRDDLELDAEALALVLSFLERIQRLEAEVRDLTAQLGAARR